MPLLDYISADEDERNTQIREIIFGRAPDVSDAETMDNVWKNTESASWYWNGFDILDSTVDGKNGVRAKFSFKFTGLDGKKRETGEFIDGTALALINEYDDVEFADVSAELTLVE